MINKADVHKMFDAISSSYDRVNRILSLGIDQFWRKKVAQLYQPKEKTAILDLATGTGDQLIALLKNHPRIERAVGIDLSEKMLDIAKEKIKKHPFAKQVRYERQSATDLKFNDRSFDLVTMSFGIRNVDRLERCLSEIHRVLSEKGSAMILEFSLPNNRFIKKAHLFYLRHVLPWIGGFFSKNREAYLYLNKTIEHFPYGSDFLKLMEEAHFSNVRALPLCYGIVTVYIGEK